MAILSGKGSLQPDPAKNTDVHGGVRTEHTIVADKIKRQATLSHCNYLRLPLWNS